MLKKISSIVLILLFIFSTIVEISQSSAALFDSNLGNAFYFDGQNNTNLRISNSVSLNMSYDADEGSAENLQLDDFTISWWQKTTGSQSLYPRVFSFGDTATYTSYFSVSEENDGKMYLWINSINIFSMPIPAHNQWNHITVSYDKTLDLFSWFLNGNKYGSAYKYDPFRDCTLGDDPCVWRYPIVDTRNLDLFIGGNNDSITGGFNGEVAGFQIYKGVRWSANFTPPNNFLTPDTGLSVSLYVGSTGTATERFIEKSANNLSIVSNNVTWSDFNLVEPTPDPTPTDSASPDPSPTVSPSPDPTPTDSASPDPSPTVSPSPDPTPTYAIHVELNDGTLGKIQYSISPHDSASDREVELNFEIDDNPFDIYVYPEEGYIVGSYLINEELNSNKLIWNEEDYYFTNGDPVSEDLNIIINLIPIPVLPTQIYALTQDFDNRLFFYKPEESAPYDFRQVQNISMGIPVSYLDNSGQIVNSFCFVDYTEFLDKGVNELEVYIPWFWHVISDFPNKCEGKNKSGEFYDELLPSYEENMFGEREVNVNFYLWEQETVDNFATVGLAKERIPHTFSLPPEITSSEIQRKDSAEVEESLIRFEDKITFEASNLEAVYIAYLSFQMPESFEVGQEPSPYNWCVFEFVEEDIFGSGENLINMPTRETVLNNCHEEYNGDWEFDENLDHEIRLTLVDAWGNFSKALILAWTKDLISINEIPSSDGSTTIPININKTPQITNKNQLFMKNQKCSTFGIWIYTKSGNLRICNSKKQTILNIAACTGKASTPTYPWTYKPKRYRAGKLSARSGISIYDAVYFYRNLVIAGVEKVSSKPCSRGSILIDKTYAKKIFDFAKKYNPTIRVLAK